MATPQNAQEDQEAGSAARRLEKIERGIALWSLLVVLGLAALVGTDLAASALGGLFALVAWVVVGQAGGFHVGVAMADRQLLLTTCIATLAGFVATAALELLFSGGVHPFATYALASSATFVGLAAGLLVSRVAVRALWRSGRLRTTTVVIGSDVVAHELRAEVSSDCSLGMDVVASFDLTSGGATATNQAFAAITELQPDRVIIGDTSVIGDFTVARRLDYETEHDARVYVLPELFDAGASHLFLSPHQLNGFPLLRVDQKARRLRDRSMALNKQPVQQF